MPHVVYELFLRTDAGVRSLLGAPLGGKLGGRSNADYALRFGQGTGAYKVEVGFEGNMVCYVLIRKKKAGQIDNIDLRRWLQTCADKAEWSDVTPTIIDPQTKTPVYATNAYRDYEYREKDASGSVARSIYARYDFSANMLVAFTKEWKADIGAEMNRPLV
jgi:hypothetical protein